MKRLLLSMFFILSTSICANSATYYVDNAAANDSGSGAIGSPKKYIPSGISLLAAGDTLIIKDGTYSGASNNITTFPTGTSGSWITIKAENDGGVNISATFQVDSTANSYTRLEGLKFSAPSTKYSARHYVKYFRCSFQGGQTCSSGCDGAFVAAAGSYQLFEDCWFYGVGGRYTVCVYEESNVIFRRCVIRRDGGYTFDGSNPEANIANYGSSNVEYQNVISIDNTLTYSQASGQPNYQSGFYATGHVQNPASNNVFIRGCIELNGQSSSFYVDTDDGSTGMSIIDSVFYANDGIIADGNTGTALTVNRLTAGSQASGISIWSGSANVSNSVIWNHTNDGDGSKTVTYTNTYNPSSYTGTGVTHINPLTNGLLYLPRIEAASTLASGGSSGGQRGADITKKIGVSGTLYGESGYNTVTTDNLWPWPNESRIKSDFASVATVGARGFATGTSIDGSSQTLTKYIWEYLGNQIPADIYGGGSSVSLGTVLLGK